MAEDSSLTPRSVEAADETAPECGCFDEMNKILTPLGGELLCNLFGPPRAIVSTYQLSPEKGKRRKKVPYVVASYCPFCGTKYQATSDTRGEANQ